jgi:two-component system, OmpR family, phosphate regulon response regulator PhoB
MNLTSKESRVQNESRLSLGERAKLACKAAKELEKAGEYKQACETLSEFWADPNRSPNLDGLDNATKANVLLRAGALTGWLGSTSQAKDQQELAKNLLTQSIELFEELGRLESAAEARADLALCYRREGSYDEARIHLKEALTSISEANTDLRACILMRSANVELDARQLEVAIYLYHEVAPLLQESSDHALKGTYHNQLALLYNNLASKHDHENHIDKALIEFAAASFHFEQAGHIRYGACTENNLGFLFLTLGRFREAHEHLDRARKLFVRIQDAIDAARVDETRARTLLAEGRLREAERTIKSAVRVLENGGQQAVLAEALTTYGTVAARLGNPQRARAFLQRAIETAQTAGDLEGAGRAQLSLIEELGSHTPADELAAVYRSADELLDRSQDPATNKRLIACARVVLDALAAIKVDTLAGELKSWDGFSLRKEITKVERLMITRALRDAGGSVTKASKLLGLRHHQSLISLLESRHRDLYEQRTIKRRRRRHLFSKPTGSKKKITAKLILHVEDEKHIAGMVKEFLVAEGYRVQTCADGLAAWEMLKSTGPVDVLIVDNNLPGVSGLELVLRVRSVPHRRTLPIIMLSGDDVEKEAWRAGVDAFLRRTEAGNRLAPTIERLLSKRN